MLKEDMREKGLCREDAWDSEGGGECCGKAIGEVNTQYTGEKQPH